MFFHHRLSAHSWVSPMVGLPPVCLDLPPIAEVMDLSPLSAINIELSVTMDIENFLYRKASMFQLGVTWFIDTNIGKTESRLLS